ncbi:DUF4340 domain-containing protein [Desemzia incerta]|uniref:DUF4340 domain-containing protein n=1 Tax=Desemzia incerta TaxID=82801 RepID=UPI0033158972
MKIPYKHSIRLFLLIGLFLAGCTNDSVTAPAEESTNTKAITLFQEYTNLTEAVLEGEEEVGLSYTSNGWTSSNEAPIDQHATNQLMTGLVQLTGTKVESSEAETLLKETAFLTATLVNGDKEEKTLQFVENAKGKIFAIDQEDTVYQVTDFPIEGEQFSSIMIQEPIELAGEELTEIEYTTKDTRFVLNQETTLSEVETAPFISGWFFHSDLQTEFSVEYNQMQQVLASLKTLKGKKAETPEPEAFSSPVQIDLSGKGKQETILIGSKVASTEYTYVKKESDGSVYQVPNVLIEQLSFEPAKLVDNFISLLPLTAVESIEIQAEGEKTVIEAEHEVVDGEEDELEIASDIFVNGKQVSTDSFRKSYQHLAMLSYEEELKDYRVPEEEVEGEISVLYTFKDNGNVLTNHLRFVPYEDGKYAVVKNDTAEFTTSISQLETMLQQVALLTEQ